MQNELAPDRLLFRFESAATPGRLKIFGRWLRRGGTGGVPVPVEILPGDRLFCQLPYAAGSVSFQLPPSSGYILVGAFGCLDPREHASRGVAPRLSDDGIHIVYTEFWIEGRRLFCISPESLISRTFREDLARLVKGSPPGGLIIDEVHAASEWSGNVRSAYRRIPRMIEDLCHINPRLAVLGVTPAAGRWVGRDIQAMLGLTDRSPSLPREVYRDGVSHEVVVVQSPGEKEAAYEQLVGQRVPALLAREGIADCAAASFSPYQDPYAHFLAAASGGLANPADAAITHHRLGDSGSPRIRIRTGMGDRVTDWLYRSADAGNEVRRHCIRLAELPTDACEADLDARRTRIPRCAGQVCTFGRPTLCDYGKQHHLIQRAHAPIREKFVETLRVLDQLLVGSEAGEAPIRVPLPEGDAGRTEASLHRLSRLGMIDIFFIEPREAPPSFKVYGFKPEITGAALALRLLQFLKMHDISHPEVLSMPMAAEALATSPESRFYPSFDRLEKGVAAEWLREAHADAPFGAYLRYPALFHRIAVYLIPMMDYVSENLKRIQYRRLWNLKRYMKTNFCRQAALIRCVHTVDAGWRCDACDRCRPDPEGPLMGNFRPGRPKPSAAVEAFLRDWLEADSVRFEEEAATVFFDRFADRSEDLAARAEYLLEEDPRNLKALHLLVRFSGGCDRYRHERDLREALAQCSALARVLRLCETDPDGEEMLKALAELSGDGVTQ